MVEQGKRVNMKVRRDKNLPRRFIEKVPGLRRPRKQDCWTSIFLLKDPALDHITKSIYFICKPQTTGRLTTKDGSQEQNRRLAGPLVRNRIEVKANSPEGSSHGGQYTFPDERLQYMEGLRMQYWTTFPTTFHTKRMGSLENLECLPTSIRSILSGPLGKQRR